MRTKKNKSTNKYLDKRYVTIPGVIVDNKDLTDTAKIVFGMIHSFKNEWNSVSPKYIAKAINLKVRAVQGAIKLLVDNKLLEERYRAKYRMLKSLLKNDGDAKAIIPFSILNKDLGSTYKVTYGMLVAAGLNELGGYNFNTVKELAEHLGLSDSSVYRHIKKLLGLNAIRRDEVSKWMFYTNDRYSRRKQAAIRRKQVAKDKKNEEWEHIEIDPATDSALDALFSQI